MKAKTLLLK